MTLLRLALADLWHDRIIACCNIAAIIGIVAPLAILAGIKAGVVDALIDDLTSRPISCVLPSPAIMVFRPKISRRW